MPAMTIRKIRLTYTPSVSSPAGIGKASGVSAWCKNTINWNLSKQRISIIEVCQKGMKDDNLEERRFESYLRYSS